MRLLLTADPEIEVPPRLYGGIERIVDVLVRRLQMAGHQVGLVAKAGSSCPADAFYPWAGERSQSTADTLSNGWTLWKARRDFRPDLVHSFSRIAYLLPHLRGPVPLVMSFQRDPTPRTVGLASKLAAPGVLTFTGCSEYIARIGRPSGGEWLGIHNFADTENRPREASSRATAAERRCSRPTRGVEFLKVGKEILRMFSGRNDPRPTSAYPHPADARAPAARTAASRRPAGLAAPAALRLTLPPRDRARS